MENIIGSIACDLLVAAIRWIANEVFKMIKDVRKQKVKYKAKNIDTDKALKAIEDSRRYQEMASNLKIEKERSFLEGIHKGLDIAENIFECSNYEKETEPSYVDGALEVLYELGKELDIPTQDIRNDFSSVDDACAVMANRIKELLSEPN